MTEVDLHLHTTVSDGRRTPADVVDFVAQRGLKAVAIVDHDITDGLEPAWEAATTHPGLTVLAGIELSTDIPGNEIHILGYVLTITTPSSSRNWRNSEAPGLYAPGRWCAGWET